MANPKIEVSFSAPGALKFAQATGTISNGQFEKIMRQSVTFAAKDYVGEKLKTIDKDIDRPTPFTRKAYDFDGAKAGGPIVARAFVRPKQAEYLQWMEDGMTKTRDGKNGPISILSNYTDKFGGAWGRGGIQKKFLGPTAGRMARGADRAAAGKKRYAAGTKLFAYFLDPKTGIAGIWEKIRQSKGKGWSTKLVIRFRQSATYKPHLHFKSDAVKYGQEKLPANALRLMQSELKKNGL